MVCTMSNYEQDPANSIGNAGHKASIILEELKEAYGAPNYVYQSINIMQNIQKEKWFTDKGPNGRIPVLVDHDAGGLGIQEGSAILS